jgi:hypothetical protein
LRLELIQKQKELRELKAEAAKANRAFSEMTFEFLQTQQGFSANLLGNLIPTGASGGLVGNTSPALNRASQGIVDQSALSSASSGKGATSSQMAVLIARVEELVKIQKGLTARYAHPEAKAAASTSYYADHHLGNV